MLNRLRANELIAITQYMNHHYRVTGEDFLELSDLFKETALAEMNHAEQLADRITMLGGNPVARPNQVLDLSRKQIVEADVLEDMVKADLSLEQSAIEDYTNSIRRVADTDPVTRRLLEDILAQEEEHADNFSNWLGQKVGFELKSIREVAS
jgi:bacterioferritin